MSLEALDEFRFFRETPEAVEMARPLLCPRSRSAGRIRLRFSPNGCSSSHRCRFATVPRWGKSRNRIAHRRFRAAAAGARRFGPPDLAARAAKHSAQRVLYRISANRARARRILHSIGIPKPFPELVRFYKVAKRRRDDISTVAAAIGMRAICGTRRKRRVSALGGRRGGPGARGTQKPRSKERASIAAIWAAPRNRCAGL